MIRFFGAGLILSIIGFWWVAGIWTLKHGGVSEFKFSRLPLWIRFYGQALAGIGVTLVIYLMVHTTLAFVALT